MEEKIEFFQKQKIPNIYLELVVDCSFIASCYLITEEYEKAIEYEKKALLIRKLHDFEFDVVPDII